MTKKASERKAEKTVYVEQIGSGIGCEKSQVQSLRALGLGRIGKKRTLCDNGCTRGLIRKVSHLIKVGGVNE